MQMNGFHRLWVSTPWHITQHTFILGKESGGLRTIIDRSLYIYLTDTPVYTQPSY